MTTYTRGEKIASSNDRKLRDKAISVRDFKAGQTLIIGEFLGTKALDSKEYRNDDGTPKQFKIHTFKNEDGKEIDVWGCAELDRLLENQAGKSMEIVYQGKQKKKSKSGQPYSSHAFDLFEAAPEAE